MTAKEYLDQIRRLDGLINSKLAILSSLENSTTRTTAVMEGEVVSHTRNVHAQQDTIAKIMDLRDEINTDTGKETTNYMETLERKLGSASKADSRMFGLSAAYGFADAGLAAITAGILLLIL